MNYFGAFIFYLHFSAGSLKNHFKTDDAHQSAKFLGRALQQSATVGGRNEERPSCDKNGIYEYDSNCFLRIVEPRQLTTARASNVIEVCFASVKMF